MKEEKFRILCNGEVRDIQDKPGIVRIVKLRLNIRGGEKK
jgi:hypothetical protein